ncbi:MAG: proton-conducting transporter membrane subunit [Pseudomonadota bacterium]
MLDTLVFGCVVFPFLAAMAVYLWRGESTPRKIVPVAAGITALSAIGLACSGSFMFAPQSFLGFGIDGLIALLDFGILFYVLYLGATMRHKLIMGLSVIQIIGLLYLEFALIDHNVHVPGFFADTLASTMVLIISIIGGLICIYGIGYMKEHEEHLHLTKSRQPRFFFVMLLFLGAMNGLVLSNNLTWLYFFWEITTLCSFLLISHDGTDIAKKNASRALWMNMIGGVAFVFAMLAFQKGFGTLSIQHLLALSQTPCAATAALLLPMALLCLAGFTKSAQMPFQSWLCGAMVAPTPVSALLHSSTMVKAGVYLIIRMAPGYAGTTLSTGVALFGAFTFLMASALAAGQSNGKKILAYSTIANLGLIVACAGINTAAAITAAILLIIFHAISKGLLFLCVGAIEQKIGSRDIEDMRGLFKVMPRTAVIAAIGIATMMLPPFGMLLAKWMAIESAAMATAAMPLLVIAIALGSAITVLFWGRWAGMLLGSNTIGMGGLKAEEQACSIAFPLKALTVAALVFSLFVPFIYSGLVAPMAALYGDPTTFTVCAGTFNNGIGMFAVYPLYILLGIGFYIAYRAAKNTPSAAASLPYMGGVQAEQDGQVGFTGPMNQFVPAAASNYYLANIFGEAKLEKPSNIIAIVLLVLLIGGLL